MRKIFLFLAACAVGVLAMHAENLAVAGEPEIIVSADHIYLNPVTDWTEYESDNYMAAEYTFTFSAKNLAKDLRMKWWRNTQESWFPWQSEKMEMWMAYEPMNFIYEPMTLNDNVNLGKDDITDFEVYIALSGIQNNGEFYSELQFKSYKADSKTELAIDKVIPITIMVSSHPTPDPNIPEGIEDVADGAKAQKILRDGQLVIIRNGEAYSVTGVRVQ